MCAIPVYTAYLLTFHKHNYYVCNIITMMCAVPITNALILPFFLPCLVFLLFLSTCKCIVYFIFSIAAVITLRDTKQSLTAELQ